MSGVSRRALMAGAAGLAASPLAACGAKAKPPAPRLLPVGNRNGLFWTPFSGPGYEECQSRLRHVNGAVGVSALRLRFAGWAVDTQRSAEVPAPNDLDVWASVEYPEGVIHRVLFVGADRGRLRAGETLESDVLDLTLPAGAVFHVRCLVKAGPGGAYPFGAVCKMGLDRYESGGAGALVNKVGGGEIGVGGHYSVFTASAVLGVPERPAHGVVIFGDSIAYGFDNGLSEDSLKGGDAAGRHGYLERALGAMGVGSLNLSVPGMAAFQMAADQRGLARRLALVEDVGDIALNTLGRNDWGTYWKSDAELLDAQARLNGLLSTAGLVPILATNLPWTDPADTRFGGDPRTQMVWRERYNAALRTRAAQTPILDVARLAERSGLWADRAWQTDGTHPNAVGHEALAKLAAPDLKRLVERTPLPAV